MEMDGRPVRHRELAKHVADRALDIALIAALAGKTLGVHPKP
jgi:hypothetical protein